MKIIKSIPLYLVSAFSILGVVVVAARVQRAVRLSPASPVSAPANTSSPRAKPTGHFSGPVQYDILANLLADDRRASAHDWQSELANCGAKLRVDTQPHALVGHAPPDFTLHDHLERSHSLHEQLGRRPVVLVFYLSYECAACVHNLFELNADLDRFRRFGVEVVAISGDAPLLTRERFERFGALNFPVLSDPGHLTAERYGVFRRRDGAQSELLLHGTFLIGCDGLVHWANCGDQPFRNDKALLAELLQIGLIPQVIRGTDSFKNKERPSP